MPYKPEFSEEISKELKKLKKKDSELFKRAQAKFNEIVDNPEHYKPLQHDLAGKRRAHVGSFVILFKVEGNKVVFLTITHHDEAYRR